jgi:hypothetical protein
LLQGITPPDFELRLQGRGMPRLSTPTENDQSNERGGFRDDEEGGEGAEDGEGASGASYGDLVVLFDIQFPQSMGRRTKSVIEEVFSADDDAGSEGSDDDDDTDDDTDDGDDDGR